MRWTVLGLLLFINTLHAGEDSLKPPQLTWDETITTCQTRKYVSSDGREWEFRFHAHDSTLPSDKDYIYSVVIADDTTAEFDSGKTTYAAYDIYRKKANNKENEKSEELAYYFGVTFYLLTQIATQN